MPISKMEILSMMSPCIDTLASSNMLIYTLATKRSFHRSCLYYILWDFGYQLPEKVRFATFQVMEELPSGRFIILTDGHYGKFALKKYGMTAFTVHLDGEINEKLSKIWRYYLREYIGKPYAEAFSRYAQELKGDYKEEIDFLLNQFDNYEQRKHYLSRITI